MRYELEYANSFKKDLKTCKKRGYNLTLLQEVIDLLQATGTLPEYYPRINLAEVMKDYGNAISKAIGS